MTTSRDCKRLIDPNSCSDTCVKGFIYDLNGVTHKNVVMTECFSFGVGGDE